MTRARDLADFNLDGKAVTINESSADLDFRVESDGNTHGLFLEASSGEIGIGEDNPATTVHITASAPALSLNTAASMTSGNRADINVYNSDRSGVGLIRFGAVTDNVGTNMQFYTRPASGSLSERMRITSDGNIGIGTSTIRHPLHIAYSETGSIPTDHQIGASSDNKNYLGFHNTSDSATYSGIALETRTSGASSWLIANERQSDFVGDLVFRTRDGGTSGSEVVRIQNNGNVGIGLNSPSQSLDVSGAAQISFVSGVNTYQYFQSTSNFVGRDTSGDFNVGVAGSQAIKLSVGGTTHFSVEGTGNSGFVRSSGVVLNVNRNGDDGSLVTLQQGATTEGTISVSGTTVTYGGFSGSHWSRLSDNSKPTILRGTVVETIDEMCTWYQAEYEYDGETKKESIALPEGKSVGDTFTYEPTTLNLDEKITVTAKIIQEDDVKHAMCKISDTADSKKVYGVFLDWDNDEIDEVNDMNICSVGTNLVRIHKDVTVEAGDLLSSNGDGTAKVQDDDIIRSKTIGKVLAAVKQETYSDGSYTVPCALYCGQR